MMLSGAQAKKGGKHGASKRKSDANFPATHSGPVDLGALRLRRLDANPRLPHGPLVGPPTGHGVHLAVRRHIRWRRPVRRRHVGVQGPRWARYSDARDMGLLLGGLGHPRTPT